MTYQSMEIDGVEYYLENDGEITIVLKRQDGSFIEVPVSGGGGGGLDITAVHKTGDESISGAKSIIFSPVADAPIQSFVEPGDTVFTYSGPHRTHEWRGGTGGSPGVMPYDLAAYIGYRGTFYSGVELCVSNKRIDIGGRIQGVSATIDAFGEGTEPNAISASPDVNGPAFAGESRELGVLGNTNCVSFAAYDQGDIIGGMTPYSPGFGKKKFVIDGVGQMIWGDDLGVTPLASGDLRFKRLVGSGGYGYLRPGLLLQGLTDVAQVPLIVRGITAQTGDLISAQNSATTPIFRVTSAGSIVCAGDVTPSGWVVSTVFAGPAGDFQLRGQALSVSLGTTKIPITILAFAGQTADLLRVTDSGSAILARINKEGFFISKKLYGPADADLANGEFTFWHQDGELIKFMAKDTSGAILEGEILLT